MKFKSRKDTLFTTVILGVNVFMIILMVTGLLSGTLGDNYSWVPLIILAVVVLLFWMFFGTNYKIISNELSYRSGPFKGKLDINSIKEVIKGKTLYIGKRPATARKGLIIKYNKYDELYISPNTNDTFIKELLSIKDDIIISTK